MSSSTPPMAASPTRAASPVPSSSSWTHQSTLIGQDIGDVFGTVSDHDHYLPGVDCTHCLDHPGDHWAARHVRQHLRQLGTSSWSPGRRPESPLAPSHRLRLSHRPAVASPLSLGGQDSNPYQRDQNPLCCQLHHPPISAVGARRRGGASVGRHRRLTRRRAPRPARPLDDVVSPRLRSGRWAGRPGLRPVASPRSAKKANIAGPLPDIATRRSQRPSRSACQSANSPAMERAAG